MEWQKLYSRLSRSPKWMQLPLDAKGLWVDCLLWVGEEETVGALPAVVPQKAGGKRWAALTTRLVDAGLWDVNPAGGYAIHDYSEHQPDADRLREQARKRKQSQRLRAGHGPVTRDVGEVTATKTKTKNKNIAKAISKSAEFEMFMAAWNGNCDPLPKIRKVPAASNMQRLGLEALDYFDNDLDVIGRAVGRCAKDEHYRKNAFGWVAFCRHLDRWTGEAAKTEYTLPSWDEVAKAKAVGA